MSSRSDDRDEMARDLPGVCSSATNCLTHTVDPDGTVWLFSTRRPDVRLRVGADEWASRPVEIGGPGELADARHELEALKALADAATPGPWKAYDVNEGTSSPPAWSVANDEFFNPHDTDEPAVDITVAYGVQADAEFIAAAREAVPRLIAEVAAATKQGAGWMDEARRQAAERDREFQRAEQAEAERDRCGDDLRRHQAAVRAIRDIHVNDGAPGGAWGVCCGQAWPCETAHALDEHLRDQS